MNKNQLIGITETSDPAFHLEIFDKLYEANVIITKNLTNKLIEKLVEHKDKCILHLTVTGMGGTQIEPFVPTAEQSVKKFKKLIDAGFPVNHVVLRIDPIVPTEKGLTTAKNVLNLFSGLGIGRVKVSFLDMYQHVKERFKQAGVKQPYTTFHADVNTRLNAYAELQELASQYGYNKVYTCGEPNIESAPCISQEDIDILNLTDKIKLEGKKEQRTHCNCPANKRQLITWEASKTGCEHKCIYCYMK